MLSNVAPWVLRILLGERPRPGDQAGGRPAQDQLPARPAAAAEVRRRPGRRLRGHPAPGRGLQPAGDGVRRGGRRRGPVGDAGRGLLPLPHRPLDPGLARRAHTLTYFGLHTPAVALRGPGGAKDLAVARALASLNEHLAEPIESCLSTDSEGRPCIEAKVAAGRRVRPGDAGRAHLPRRPGVAVGLQPGAPGHAGPAVGRGHRPRQRAAVRRRCAGVVVRSRASAGTTPRRRCSPRAERATRTGHGARRPAQA